MRARIASFVLVSVACHGPTSASVASSSAPSSSSSSPALVRPGLSSEETALVDRLCATATCAGRFAHLELWRDGKGALGRVLYDGDIDRCSHPPRLYFDATGKETLGIPNQPVIPGSPEALEFQSKQEAELEGLTKAQDFNCQR